MALVEWKRPRACFAWRAPAVRHGLPNIYDRAGLGIQAPVAAAAAVAAAVGGDREPGDRGGGEDAGRGMDRRLLRAPWAEAWHPAARLSRRRASRAPAIGSWGHRCR